MSDSDKTYVVLTFATVNWIEEFTTGKWESVNIGDRIIEVAAVKIKEMEIAEHFSTFVALDGYYAADIEFSYYDINRLGIYPEHLIGAPSLEEVCKRVHSFCEGATIVAVSSEKRPSNPYRIFCKEAEKYGYVFDNPLISIYDVYLCFKFKGAIREQEEPYETLSAIRLSGLLPEEPDIEQILEKYDIFIFSNLYDKKDWYVRKDALGWALAFAQLFIKIVCYDEEEMEDDAHSEAEKTDDEYNNSSAEEGFPF